MGSAIPGLVDIRLTKAKGGGERSTKLHPSSPPSAVALAARFLPGVSFHGGVWSERCKLEESFPPQAAFGPGACHSSRNPNYDINQNTAPILIGNIESRPSASLHVHVNENCPGSL